MQGDERSNIALKSTYGSIQNNELHQAMQTGTVPSELTGRVKKLNNLYKHMHIYVFYNNV
jgi:hypothetical protein